MDKLKYFILKYPNQLKYGVLLVDMLFILIAIRIFINYTNIEQAIQETAHQSEDKTMELWYAKNFWLAYERSDYAQMFLKHENNMLLPGEFIIKFTDKTKIVNTWDKKETDWKPDSRLLTTAQEARQQFLKEKLFLNQNSNSTK